MAADDNDTSRETPSAKHRAPMPSSSHEDLAAIGVSDRELILTNLKNTTDNLQAQIDAVSERVLELDDNLMRHLQAHARVLSDGPQRNEVVFKAGGLSARGRFIWIAFLLILTAVAGLAWHW